MCVQTMTTHDVCPAQDARDVCPEDDHTHDVCPAQDDHDVHCVSSRGAYTISSVCTSAGHTSCVVIVWTHIVVVTDDEVSTCWYGVRPFAALLGNDKNYTFTWLRLANSPTDEQLDDTLDQIRSRTRGISTR